MKTEDLINQLNQIYVGNFNTLIESLRANGDPDEMSYDLEEVYDDTKSLGDLIDYLVENEKCEIWDTPYITHLILTEPDKFHVYFQV